MKGLAVSLVLLFGLSICLSARAADFDGDGTNDIGIFRPGTGLWAIRGGNRVYFGTSGDQPVPGDYNGNGTADIAIFRPSNGLWAVNGGLRAYFGQNGDQPLPGVMGGGGGGGQWTRSGNDIYYNTGNIGIGTANPTNRLTVTGPSNNTLPVRINNSDAGTSLYLGFGATAGATYSQIYSSGDDLVLQGFGGKDVGIGTTSPEATLHISDTYPDLSLEGTVASQRWSLNVAHDGDFFLWNDTGSTNAIWVDASNNNVGIGTTSPAYTLEVSGPIFMEDTTLPTYSPNHSGIYSIGGALYAMAGNGHVTTLISPHDEETGEWIFYSKNLKTGRVVRVDMERMVRAIEKLTGETFMVEKWEKP